MGSVIPKRVVRLVLERDGVCMISSRFCTGTPTVADHRVGRGMGGNKALNVPHALVAACGVCNGVRESDADVAAECERRGILIRRSQSTARDLAIARSTPVTAPDGRMWFLLPDGTRQELTEPPF